jgi:SNF family Na+-dependent transporter
MKPTREKFGGRAAVILAMAGSAIGMLALILASVI